MEVVLSFVPNNVKFLCKLPQSTIESLKFNNIYNFIRKEIRKGKYISQYYFFGTG